MAPSIARVRRATFALTMASALALSAATVAPTTAAPNIRLTGFTLINAETDQPIAGFDPIPQNATINLAMLPTRKINVRANGSQNVRSVRIKKNTGAPRVDTGSPYSLVGDKGGDFRPWTPRLGRHTVSATPFGTKRDGGRVEGATVTLRFQVVDVAGGAQPRPSQNPTPTAPPSAAPSPSSAPSAPEAPTDAGGGGGGGSASRCGAIPGVPAGWERRVTTTFSEETPLGAWPGPVTGRDWRGRTAGWRDSSGRGIYDAGRTVSEHDGMLDVWVHSEGGNRYVAAPVPRLGNVHGMRISMCMRADRIPGYKIAFLLWPQEGPGNYHGEIDFPEGNLRAGSTVHGFVHYDPKPGSGRHQDGYPTGVSSEQWHRYTIEWDPGSPRSQTDDYVSFQLDGREIGRTTGAKVPDGPMHYVMQIETYLKAQELPPPAEGHVQVDWVTIELPGGGGPSGEAN